MQRVKIKPNEKKLRELILLISEWSQSDPNFGATKLNKLLFHCDFCAYLTYGVPITGEEYFALPQGPAPRRLVLITAKMKENEELAYQIVPRFGYSQKRPVALRPPKLSEFTAQEMAVVHQTIERFWGMNATEISDQSHIFLGWKVARNKETIPYSTALVGRRPPSAQERKRGLKLQSLAEKHLAHGRH